MIVRSRPLVVVANLPAAFRQSSVNYLSRSHRLGETYQVRRAFVHEADPSALLTDPTAVLVLVDRFTTALPLAWPWRKRAHAVIYHNGISQSVLEGHLAALAADILSGEVGPEGPGQRWYGFRPALQTPSWPVYCPSV